MGTGRWPQRGLAVCWSHINNFCCRHPFCVAAGPHPRANAGRVLQESRAGVHPRGAGPALGAGAGRGGGPAPRWRILGYQSYGEDSGGWVAAPGAMEWLAEGRGRARSGFVGLRECMLMIARTTYTHASLIPSAHTLAAAAASRGGALPGAAAQGAGGTPGAQARRRAHPGQRDGRAAHRAPAGRGHDL